MRGAPRQAPLSAVLSDGRTAALRRREREWVLDVDGTPQSAIDPLDPTALSFAYIRHMAQAIDAVFPARRPLTALHLGAGALTLPRYLEHSRPGSRQQVLELEPALVELVRGVAPLPAGASIRIRYGDARRQLARLPRGLHGAADLVVVDVFAGPSTPAHVTSLEFFTELAAFPAPGGLVLVNVADGRELRFARGCIAGLRETFGRTALIADPGVLKGRRFGNIAAVASREPVAFEGLPRLLAAGYPPATLADDAQTLAWLRGARPVRDAQAVPSPVPGGNVFRIRREDGW